MAATGFGSAITTAAIATAAGLASAAVATTTTESTPLQTPPRFILRPGFAEGVRIDMAEILVAGTQSFLDPCSDGISRVFGCQGEACTRSVK